MTTISLHGCENLLIEETGTGEHRWAKFHFKGREDVELIAFHDNESILPTRDHLWWLALLDQSISSRIAALPRLCTDYDIYESFIGTTGRFTDFGLQ